MVAMPTHMKSLLAMSIFGAVGFAVLGFLFYWPLVVYSFQYWVGG